MSYNSDQDDFYPSGTIVPDGFGLSDEDSASDRTEIDDDENRVATGRKRGRPFGSKLSREDSESDKENELPLHLQRETRKTKALVPIPQLPSIICCTALCLGLLGTFELQQARTAFQAMSKHNQHSWILDYLRTHSALDDGSFKFIFVVGTATICFTAWQLIHGIPQSTAYRIMKEYKDGKIAISPSNLHKQGTFSQKTQESLSWLSDYVDKYADKVPNQPKLHLPSCLTKLDVYNSMCVDLEEMGIKPCSTANFNRAWRKHFSHVVIPAVNRFAKCEKCTLIKSRLERTKDKKERQLLRDKREKHLQLQNAERRKYYKHAQKAKRHPEKYMSIIIDGMDQHKTFLPHFKQESKFMSTMTKLKTHVTGAIVHGLCVLGFFDVCQWPHSSNLTLNVLLRIIARYMHSLPPVLYLQMDNCSRENKNKFVFAFCSLLVELKIFRKIKVSFLMVGHTHEDVDQVFSRFSTWLLKHSAVSMPKLMMGFEKCYHPSPASSQLDMLYNITGWIIPHMELMSMHSKPHVFRFTLSSSDKAILHTKKWSTNDQWRSCEYETPDTCLLKQHPQGVPLKLAPDYSDIDISLLEKDMNTVAVYIHEEEDKAWWNGWLNEIKDSSEADRETEKETSWLLTDIVRNVREKRNLSLPVVQPVVINWSDLSDEDDPIPPVTVGRKKNPPKTLQPDRPMQVGDLALAGMLKYVDYWPQLGEIKQVNEKSVTLAWYKGSMSGSWSPWMIPVAGQKHKRKPWEEDVSKSVIWLYGFDLTPKNNLPKSLKTAIYDYYD